MHFYYMGGNGQHTNFRETSFGRITFDEDKFAYITSNTSDSEGRILTSALRAEADGIWVLADFDPENSSLRAALLAGDDYRRIARGLFGKRLQTCKRTGRLDKAGVRKAVVGAKGKELLYAVCD